MAPHFSRRSYARVGGAGFRQKVVWHGGVVRGRCRPLADRWPGGQCAAPLAGPGRRGRRRIGAARAAARSLAGRPSCHGAPPSARSAKRARRRAAAAAAPVSSPPQLGPPRCCRPGNGYRRPAAGRRGHSTAMKRSVSCFNLRAAAGSDDELDAQEVKEVGGPVVAAAQRSPHAQFGWRAPRRGFDGRVSLSWTCSFLSVVINMQTSLGTNPALSVSVTIEQKFHFVVVYQGNCIFFCLYLPRKCTDQKRKYSCRMSK